MKYVLTSWGLLSAAVALALPFHPDIPRTWDNRELAALLLALARWLRSAQFLFCLAPLLLSAAAQNPGPDRPVQLSGVVRDRHGRFVRDLETADFTITQDGADVAIRSLRLIDTTAAPFVTLIFDRLRGEPARLAEQAAEKLLTSSAANTVFSVWLIDDKLVLLQSFSTDRSTVKAMIRSAVSKAPLAGTPQGTWAALSTATLETADRLTRESPFGLKAATLIAAAREQRSEARRKALVYFSEGLPVGSSDQGLSNIVSAARQANVTLHTVDVSALSVTEEEEGRRRVANMYSLAAQNLEHVNYKGQPYIHQEITGEIPSVDMPQQDAAPLQALADQTGGFSVSKSSGLDSRMRRIAQDLSSYYEITYMRPAAVPDGRYHPITVKVRRKGAAVSFPAGLYAMPETADGALPYELPLWDALSRAPILDLPLRAGLWRFRSPDPDRTSVSIFFEVAGADVHFDQDDSAGVVRAHVSAVALVRDQAGQVVARFGGDRPVETAPALLAELRQHPFAFQKRIELPAGQYTLEIAVRDQLGDRVHAEKIAFPVEPDRGGLALSNLSLVDHLAAMPGSPSDGAFSLPAKSVLPSLDATLTGGKEAIATLFFRLYPAAEGAPARLSFEIWQDGRQRLREPLQFVYGTEDPSAQIISLNLERLPAGQYEIRIIAEQRGLRAAESLRLRITGGAAPGASASADTENGDTIVVKPAEELPALPPSLDQQQLLDRACLAALSYSQHLPNFVSTQVTRRMLDQAGTGKWRNLDEWSQLVSYYDRQEHYQNLGRRGGTDDFASNTPSLNSVGEFGSLLHSVFAAESEAMFAWSRTDSIRGRPVQVFSYRVDLAHSQNRISYSLGTAVTSSLVGFRGLLFIDPVTARVLRITEEIDSLPSGLPVRDLSLTLDYGDMEVGNAVYLLPHSFTLDIRLRKRTHVRNEITFRSYQRFNVQSRLVPAP
jgi:VWFA-related protein